MFIKSGRITGHTAMIGTGLSTMRRHLKTSTGLCRTCRSHKCIMTAYIPKYPQQWTWAEQYQQFMASWCS